jgi:hypothetical protein
MKKGFALHGIMSQSFVGHFDFIPYGGLQDEH